MEEEELRQDGELPKVAVVPIMKRKTFKALGDPTVQAGQLADCIKLLSAEELLDAAEQRRVELEETGELDRLGDIMPKCPLGNTGVLDDSFLGTHLEVCWRYWRPPTDEEIAAGEKRKNIGVKIWCEGEVVLIANGTTTIEGEGARCKKLAKAGAVRIKWPADLTRKVPEPESFTWNILQEGDVERRRASRVALHCCRASKACSGSCCRAGAEATEVNIVACCCMSPVACPCHMMFV